MIPAQPCTLLQLKVSEGSLRGEVDPKTLPFLPRVLLIGYALTVTGAATCFVQMPCSVQADSYWVL